MHDDDIKSLKAGPYTLVARWHQDRWVAVVFAKGKIIVNENVESLEAGWRFLLNWLAERIEDKARERGAVGPTAADASDAFRAINERLSNVQRKMLSAHLKAPGHLITATQLANAAGYKSSHGANLQYGFVGAMWVFEMPEILPKRPDGSRIATCAIASADDTRQPNEGEWLWKMRPHIVEGLRESRIA